MQTMVDAAVETVTIAAPPERCWEIITDFERYPEWARDVKQATVVARDENQRGLEVAFEASAIGRSTRYVLAYDYSGAPERIAWRLTQGDIMDALDGAYTFLPSASMPGGTDVVYELAIDLVVPMPGFVKRRAEVRILHNGLRELKARAELA